MDNSRPVDGLSQGQKVDPDKEREKEKRELNKQYNSSDEPLDEENEALIDTPVIKYDLSQSEKYTLKVDDATNEIIIIDKATTEIVQRVSADDLSHFVNYLSNSQGSIVNRKF